MHEKKTSRNISYRCRISGRCVERILIIQLSSLHWYPSVNKHQHRKSGVFATGTVCLSDVPLQKHVLQNNVCFLAMEHHALGSLGIFILLGRT